MQTVVDVKVVLDEIGGFLVEAGVVPAYLLQAEVGTARRRHGSENVNAHPVVHWRSHTVPILPPEESQIISVAFDDVELVEHLLDVARKCDVALAEAAQDSDQRVEQVGALEERVVET